MDVRYIDKPEITGFTNNFNMHSLSEVIVYFPEGDADSEFISKLEVKLEDGTWMSMLEAFGRRILVPNNYNERFRQARNDIEVKRGWFDD